MNEKNTSALVIALLSALVIALLIVLIGIVFSLFIPSAKKMNCSPECCAKLNQKNYPL